MNYINDGLMTRDGSALLTLAPKCEKCSYIYHNEISKICGSHLRTLGMLNMSAKLSLDPLQSEMIKYERKSRVVKNG